jgi:hypothetical protein
MYVSASGKRRKDGSKGSGCYLCKSHHPKYAGTMPKCQQGWIKRPKLDAVLISFFQKTLTNVELLSAIISTSARRSAEVIPFPVVGPEQVLEKLRRRDRRWLDMCASETITITECQERRATLRQEMAALENRLAETAQRNDEGMTIDKLADFLVRSVTGFDRAEPDAQKAILQGVFDSVFWRGLEITAFRFARSFVADFGQAKNALSETIHLDPPFRILEPAAEGHKRCSCCQETRPVSAFYRGRRQCIGCFNGRLKREKRQKKSQKPRLGEA